jgi:hypothetical protein
MCHKVLMSMYVWKTLPLNMKLTLYCAPFTSIDGKLVAIPYSYTFLNRHYLHTVNYFALFHITFHVLAVCSNMVNVIQTLQYYILSLTGHHYLPYTTGYCTCTSYFKMILLRSIYKTAN